MKIAKVALVAAVVATPMSLAAQDFSGFRAGISAGALSGNSNASGDEADYGLFAGYNYDLGNGLIGGEIAYNSGDINATGVTLEDSLQLKARYGVQVGTSGLAYGTVGYARAKASTGGHDDGYVVGAGYEHALNDQVFVGGEYLYSEYKNVGATSTDASAHSIAVRLGVKF